MIGMRLNLISGKSFTSGCAEMIFLNVTRDTHYRYLTLIDVQQTTFEILRFTLNPLKSFNTLAAISIRQNPKTYVQLKYRFFV